MQDPNGFEKYPEYWIQLVAHEEMKIQGPQEFYMTGEGYRFTVNWGSTGNLTIRGGDLSFNGKSRGSVRDGDRIRVNASTGEITVNDIKWK